MVPFYPDLEIVPEKIAALDFSKFTKEIDKALPNMRDPYIKLEYKNGFFSNESILEAYKAICEEVIVPLEELLPGYYA
jgi:exodeoxyribonuclease V gamma subunit